MRVLTALAIVIVLGLWTAAIAIQPADQKVILMLDGKQCGSYLNDVATALKKVPGVKKVDLKSMPGHAVVETETGTAKELEAAVNGVKLSGWSCTAKEKK